MNQRTQLLHPRDELMQMMDRIYRYRMTTTSGGNLSIRDRQWRRLGHAVSCGQGQSAAGRHCLRQGKRLRRRPSSAIVGITIPPGDLCSEAGSSRHCACSPSRSCGVQHRWPGTGYAPVSPGQPHLRHGRICPLCASGKHRSGPGDCRHLQAGFQLRDSRKPRSRRGRRGFAAGLSALRDVRVHGQDHHQGKHAGERPLPGRRAAQAVARRASAASRI